MEAAAEVTKARARADSMPSTVLDTGKGDPDQVLQLSTKYRENIWRTPLAPTRAHLKFHEDLVLTTDWQFD